ncbi:MAG: extracellular solute-binding protein [Oscillospiraceae bacterium]|nr:extracellular solute-binding protein [Oscillospiraceae bacterium]
MKNKAILRIILMILISCVVFLAVSCSQNSNADSNTRENAAENAGDSEGDVQDEDTEIEGETEQPRVYTEAPVNDYGGYKLRILSKPSSTVDHHWDARDIDAEEENGDIINDAVYKRNTAVSERYNIEIARTESENPGSMASKAVRSGSDEYDVMFSNLDDIISPAQSGCFVNLKTVPYLDLPKPWYDQKSNEQLSIGGKLYMTFCDFTILDKDATWVYLFNKKLIQEMQLDDPYQIVKEGKWTIDKLYDMCKDAAKDLDGDGIMTWHDQFGWQGESGNMYMGIVASGVQMTAKNSDDLPEYLGLGEKGMTAFTKLLRVFGDKSISLRVDDVTGFSGDVWTDVMDASFIEGRILFLYAGMNRVTLFRSMDTDFGIIPSPKVDEIQPEYCSTVSGWAATPLTILTTVTDLEKIGILMDALCAESSYTLIPAYYDVQLKTKLARDDESAEMLDLIFGRRIYDLGRIYGWGGLNTIFANAMTKNDSNIMSAIEKAEPKFISAMEKTVAAFDSLDH